MTMPSNKWEEAVDDIFEQHYGNKITHAVCAEECMEHENYKNLKLALTNAVKAIVIDATPDKYGAESWQEGIKKSGYDRAIATYQANLLKAIGDKNE